MNLNSGLRGNVSEENYKRMVEIKGREPVNPVGSCFDSAAFQLVFSPTSRFTAVKLCHGIIKANAPGSENMEVPHAWIEANDAGQSVVLDPIWGEVIPRDHFYSTFKPYMVHTYSKGRVTTLWAMHDHPGPWHPKLIEKMKVLNGKKDS